MFTSGKVTAGDRVVGIGHAIGMERSTDPMRVRFLEIAGRLESRA